MIRPVRGHLRSRRSVAFLHRIRRVFGRSAASLSLAACVCAGLAAISAAVATRLAAVGAVCLVATALVLLLIGLARRAGQTLVVAVVSLTIACGLADLPTHPHGALLVAAVQGAGVLIFAEAGGTALEPPGGKRRRGRPAIARGTWVAAICAGSIAVGWCLAAVEPDFSGFGVLALAVGVAAAVCLVSLVAVLANRFRSPAGARGGPRARPQTESESRTFSA